MTYATGYDLAAAIDPESYHLTHDAAGVAYAFRMDDEARRQLAECVKASAPSRRAVEAFGVTPNHLRLRVDPAREGEPDPISAWDGVLRGAVRLYNEREATDGLDELRIGDTFVGMYRPDGTATAEAFIEEQTGQPPDDHEPVYEYTNPEPEPEQRGRWLAWRVVVLHDSATFDPPEPSGFSVPADERPGFEWDIEAIEATVADRVDWPGGRREIQHVAVHDAYTVADIYQGALGAPQGLARRVRRAMLQYNRHRDAEVGVGGGTVKRPALAIKRTPHYVGAIESDAVDEWLGTLPALDGEPIAPEPDPEPEPEPEPEPSGGLAGLNPFGGSG